MVAIAIGLLWTGYTGGLWGYCLVRGYNITPKQLLSPHWPPGAAASTPQFGGGVGNAVGQIVGRTAQQAAPLIPPPSGGGKVQAR